MDKFTTFIETQKNSIFGEDFLQNLMYGSSITTILVILFVYFFLGSRIKTFFSLVSGEKFFITDSSLARYLKREVIFRNNKLMLSNNINLKSFLVLYVIFMTSLISPFISLVLFLGFFYKDTRTKLDKFENFSYFDISFDDYFGNLLNKNLVKLDYISQNLIIFSFVIILISILTNSLISGIVGITALSVFILFGLFCYWNIDSYRVNLKLNSYYELSRLLNTSLYGNNKILMLFFIISIYASFKNAEISSFLWIVTMLNLCLKIAIMVSLKKEVVLSKEHKEIENREYTKIELLGSMANPTSYSRGYKWTTPIQIKAFSQKNKDGIYLDNFAFYPETINRTSLSTNPLILKALENVELRLNPFDFAKQVMIIGGMGSGKTVLINNVVTQNIKKGFKDFKSHIFNDIKGDFTKKFYREDKDYILNLFDSRGAVWDIFTEMEYNIEAGNLFASNLYASLAGKNTEFFGGRAKQMLSAYIQESFFEGKNNIESWEILFKKIEAGKEAVKNSDDKTTQSVLSVMDLIIDTLSIMKYQICVEKRKIFVIAEFIVKKDTQLFLLNNKNYENRLTPYLNGVFGAIVGAIMSKNEDDAKEHQILGVWDEFVTLANQIDNSTLIALLTAVRSFGLANILAMQFLPAKEEIVQLLDSSRYALIVFNINDEYTLKKVASKFGKQEMLSLSMSPVTVNSEGKKLKSDGDAFTAFAMPFEAVFDAFTIKPKKENNKSYSLGMSEMILENSLQSMPKYHHLTFIPSEEVKEFSGMELQRGFRLMVYKDDISNIETSENFMEKTTGLLYLGYSKFNEINLQNSNFVKWDMKGFYESKNMVLKEKEYSELTEKERFTHYYRIKWILEVSEISDYCKKNNLIESNLSELFIEVEENEEKILNFKSSHTKDEILNLYNEILEITDDDKRYEFVKEHNLIGCVLTGLMGEESES